MTRDLNPGRGGFMTPPFNRATVEDMMRPGILSCHADAPVTEVADTMATHQVHAVVVVGISKGASPDDQDAIGLVCDLDLIRAAAARPEPRSAGEIARMDAITIDASTPLTEAARIMALHGTAHLIVVRGGQPVGVLSGLDIAGAIAWGGGP